MDYLPTLVNALVVAVVGVLVMYVTRDQIKDVRDQVKDVKEDVRDLKQDIRQLRDEIVGVRSDLTQVALAVGAQPRPRPQTG
jgi:hypothetical protein